jgi:pyruvate/2-oxoacid:ferredoxin oxidoreductase beta subunit
VSFLSFTAAVCRGCGEFLTMSLLQKDDAPLHAEAEREKMADLGVVF